MTDIRSFVQKKKIDRNILKMTNTLRNLLKKTLCFFFNLFTGNESCVFVAQRFDATYFNPKTPINTMRFSHEAFK